MDKLISVIIINYNNYIDTLDCLKSLQNQLYKNYEIILLDNGSNYESYVNLKKVIKPYIKTLNINLFRNNLNVYFASANNKAINISNGTYICLLNNDTLVSDNYLEELINFYDKYPNAGMISPKIKVNDNKDYIWYAGAIINYRNVNIAKLRGFWEYDRSNDKYLNITKTDYAAGTTLFFKREIIEKVGFLDEIFFMYYEEVDWNLRAKKLGYHNYYLPKTIVYHKVPPLNNKQSLFKWFFTNRNSQIIVWKHSQRKDLLVFYIQFIKKNLKNLKNILRNCGYYILYIQIHSIYQGFRIGLKKRMNCSCKKHLVQDFKFISKNQKKMQYIHLII